MTNNIFIVGKGRDSDVLIHYGRKGMRWYQHVFGDRSFGGSGKRKNKTHAKSDGTIKGSGEKVSYKNIEAKKQAILKSRSAKELYKNANLFTTKELKAAYDRLLLERNIKKLSSGEISKGMAYVNTAINLGKKTSDLLNTGTKLWNSYADLAKAFDRTDFSTIGGESKVKKATNKGNGSEIFEKIPVNDSSVSSYAKNGVEYINKYSGSSYGMKNSTTAVQNMVKGSSKKKL